MTDLQIAINNLTGHTICLCKGERCIFSEKRGIAPVMDLIAEGTSLAGYSVADTVVGKAAALLFVKCKIKCAYAETLSEKGERILRLYGLDFEYGTLAKCIINRAGTDICPMEKAVEDTDDPEEAYLLLKNQTAALKTRGTA